MCGQLFRSVPLCVMKDYNAERQKSLTDGFKEGI